MDRGASPVTVPRFAKSQTRLKQLAAAATAAGGLFPKFLSMNMKASID